MSTWRVKWKTFWSFFPLLTDPLASSKFPWRPSETMMCHPIYSRQFNRSRAELREKIRSRRATIGALWSIHFNINGADDQCMEPTWTRRWHNNKQAQKMAQVARLAWPFFVFVAACSLAGRGQSSSFGQVSVCGSITAVSASVCFSGRHHSSCQKYICRCVRIHLKTQNREGIKCSG